MAEVDPNPTPPPAAAPPRVGSYRLMEQLGSGGMSSVFRAEHIESGLEVAIKILPRSLARNPTLLQRFLREAKSAEALQDPHIVEIFDRGTEDGRYYIVLEYMPGGDLHDWVRERGPLPIHEALEVIKSVARGLRHAAQQGLIHRDIKPANLLRTADGHVKVTDLGLALQTSEEDERVTRDGTTVGTVDYMAPEQARDSRATSVRSDIYSLGCTFYFLLTGQAPFPGGDVPEKLRRHAYDPPPDVRGLRPDVPEDLADLIRRMMAKKPERRFVDYDHLLMALEELPIAPPGEALTALVDDEPETSMPEGGSPLMALIDDEGEDQGGARPGGRSGEEPSWTALIDDEDDAGPGGFTLGPPTVGEGEPGSTKSVPAMPVTPRRPRPPAPSRPDVDLAALAGVEDASGSPRSARRPPARPSLEAGDAARNGSGPPGTPRRPEPAAGTIPVLGEREAEEGMQGPVTAPRPRPQPDAGSTLPVLILRGALAGLVLIFLAIGVSHLMSAMASRPRTAGPSIELDASEGVAKSGPDGVAGALGPVEAGRGLARGLPAPDAWDEPGEPAPGRPESPRFAAEVRSSLGLDDAEPGRAGPAPAPVVEVRRGGAVRDREHVADLRTAFETLTGTVEIHDDGPFFADDLRIPGRERLLRAGAGRRPIVVVRASRQASVRERPGLVVLDRARLTVEGIDLVVNASDLAPAQAAIFLLRGGSELTLRDCTITVVGPIARPLAAVQVGEPARPGQEAESRVRLERTLVRGPGLVAVRLAEGPAEVVASRSALLVGDAPMFAASGGSGSGRSLKLLGSIAATSGPCIELAGSAAGPGTPPLAVRALGTTFARAEGGGTSGAGLVMFRDAPDGGRDGTGVDWRGEANRFEGWRPVANAGGRGRKVALADLDALRAATPGTDAESRASGDAWAPETQSGWATPAELAAAHAELGPILAHVAQPTPHLKAWTVGELDVLPSSLADAEVPIAPEPTPAGPGVQVIDFDADTAPASGDLGLYLASHVRPDASRVVVRARGVGWHPFSPVRLAEGVSFELHVASPAGGKESDRLVWRPAEGARGPALIDVVGAALTIVGATFERDARADLRRVVRVERGRLELFGCRFLAPGGVETGGGGLIEFRSEGTRPLRAGDETTYPVADLSDCVLITGGDALTADLGRGVVRLRHCALASGSDAIVLRPQRVARGRFEADLRMERCTVVSESNVLRFDAWPGHADGPDRPWLISTKACAFLDSFDRGRNPSTTVLLRAEPGALASGAMLWQSSGDAYHVAHYLVAGEATPPPVSFPEIGRLWVDLWGTSHVREPRTGAAGVEFAVGNLTPGEVAPADLILRPAGHPGATDVGADLSRLGLAPTSAGRGR